MRSNREAVGPGEAEALAADRARRAASTRAIAIFFALMSLLTLPQTLVFAYPWVPILEVVSALGYFVVWWLSRRREEPNAAAAAVLGIFLVQCVASSATSIRPEDVVNTAYFAALAPFLAAATMRPRGVVLTGLAFGLGLAAQIALHVEEGTFADFSRLLPAVYFFLPSWFIAVVTSLASRRALEAHAEDETRAVAAREQARFSEARYRLVADRVSDLVSVVDDHGTYVYASPSYERVLGLRSDELVGNTTPGIVHPDDLESMREAFARAQREGSGSTVARVRTAAGAYRWFHVALSRLDDPLLGRGSVALSARDITEVRELSAELESTRRMEALGRLAGGVAHDFNNLLLVIQSCSEFAAARLPRDHASRKELAEVQQATERAAAITRQLLTFAKRQVLQRHERAVAAEVVRELTPILARVVGENVTLDVAAEPGAEAMAVQASAVQIEQLLLNLAANARDAMPDGGTLRVRVREVHVEPDHDPGLAEGRYAEIEVRDGGVGMTEEVKSRIFEPFFTTKPSGRGTGLGLATVFGLVSQLGGRVTVTSAPGEGTTFSLLVPAAPDDAASVAEDAASDGAGALPPPALGPLRILVVDDEPPVRAMMARTLASSGHSVLEAGSIDEAIALAEAPGARFEAIVTDVVLGSGDGIAMLDRVRAAQPEAAVVVVSGFSPSPERVAGVREWGAEYLAKPFGSAELNAALARARGLGSPEA